MEQHFRWKQNGLLIRTCRGSTCLNRKAAKHVIIFTPVLCITVTIFSYEIYYMCLIIMWHAVLSEMPSSSYHLSWKWCISRCQRFVYNKNHAVGTGQGTNKDNSIAHSRTIHCDEEIRGGGKKLLTTNLLQVPCKITTAMTMSGWKPQWLEYWVSDECCMAKKKKVLFVTCGS